MNWTLGFESIILSPARELIVFKAIAMLVAEFLLAYVNTPEDGMIIGMY